MLVPCRDPFISLKYFPFIYFPSIFKCISRAEFPLEFTLHSKISPEYLKSNTGRKHWLWSGQVMIGMGCCMLGIHGNINGNTWQH